MCREISVLLVDDEQPVADLAATHLERLRDGMAVEIETSAATALARFERDPEGVDCIVSDYTMPGMDGLSFLTAVRDSNSDVPFVLFTGKGSEEIASEAVSAGVTDYLQKGSGTEQYELLANRVENAVEAHRAEERATQLARINGVVAEVQRELVRQSTREGIENRTCASLASGDPYTLAWVGVPDDDGGFVVRERAGRGTEYLDTVPIRTDDAPLGPVGRALATGEPQVARDVTDDAAFGPWGEAIDHDEFGSVVALPLSYDAPSHDAASYGVLGVYSGDRYAFGDDERDALTELAGTVAHAIHAAETNARLERREHALAESERKYRSLIDAAPDAIFVSDADTGEIVETNAAAEDLLGRDREAILGMVQSDLHPPEERDRYEGLFADQLERGSEHAVRYPDGSPMSVVRADGERVPVEISSGVVEVGDRTLIQGVFRDVSAREEHERELRAERAVTESLFDATPDPIYAFDSEGNMLRWNETFESVVNYSTDEIAGMNALEFVPPADHELIRDRMEAIVERGETITVESAFVTSSGEVISHEFSGAPLAVGGLRGIVGTGRDISERNARHRERERYQTAIEAVDDAVYVLDERGKFEFVNEAFCDLTGHDESAILGNGVELIKDEATVRLFEDILRGMLSAGTEETTVEFEVRTAAGERVPCEDHLAVRMDNGEFHGVAGAIRDISDRRDREATIAALHTATRDLVRAEDRTGVASATAAATEEVLGFPLTAVRLYDPETDTLEPTATTDVVAERYGQRPTYARGEGLPWRAFESGGPVVASAEAVNYRTMEFENALYVPIGDHGILSIVSQDREFEDAEIELARVLAANAATALDRLAREVQLRRYKRMLDTAGDSICALDTQLEFTTVNDRFVTELGYAREEVIGEPLSKILGPDAVEAGARMVRRLLSDDADATTGTSEFDVQTANGTSLPCEAQIAVLRTDGVFEGTVVVARDVSEKKRNETYRRKLYETTSSSAPTFDERIERMLRLGCEYLGMDVGFMTHIEDDTLEVVAARGSHDHIQPGAECPLSEAYCRRTVETDGPFAVHDAAAGWKGDPAREVFSLDSYIGGTVMVDNEVYGTFCFADTTAREPFSSAEEGFVDLVVRGVGRELERREHERALSALHDATREMVAATDRDEVAEIAVETVADVLDIPMNGIWRYDATDEVLRPVVVSEGGDAVVEDFPTYADDGSLSWKAFETGEAMLYDRVDRATNVYNPDTPIRSEMVLPVGGYGVMNVGSVEPAAFTDRDFSLTKLLVANTETAMERAEREHLLRRRQRELETERDRLTALFENVTDAALSYEVVDGEPIAERVNARFEEVFGYSGEEVIGENIDDYIVPDEYEDEATSFNEALTVDGESLQATVRRRTAEGVRDFLLHVVPLDLGEQNAGGYTLYTDITDQKRRERELERQNQLLDEFAGVISHDLRNPMSVARGRLELAEAESPSEHHDDALWALDRMEALIEGVLTLARQGKVIGDTEPVSVPTVAERAWRTAGVETASLTVEDSSTIEADPDRLTRLFENLFRNAVEHAGEECAVVVGQLDGGFFVEDDGPGIDAGEREKVFEHGYSTTDSGTGLGLMIVRSIAEAHGWTVHAVETAEGARFEVTT